jgi:hypothetical protein
VEQQGIEDCKRRMLIYEKAPIIQALIQSPDNNDEGVKAVLCVFYFTKVGQGY